MKLEIELSEEEIALAVSLISDKLKRDANERIVRLKSISALLRLGYEYIQEQARMKQRSSVVKPAANGVARSGARLCYCNNDFCKICSEWEQSCREIGA